MAQLKKIVSSHGATTQAGLIAHLNPIITRWCQYYATVVSKEAFASLLTTRLGNCCVGQNTDIPGSIPIKLCRYIGE
nr:group II intron maturase-specific domain-containing protein [Leptolyngbya sp. FACHB-541]